ncbi:transposase [Sinorhizobium sp. 8-89]|nr:transposase [Sinorhizobium sp. 7-81]
MLDHSQPALPMRPGQIERRSHDYVRHGTLSLFAVLGAATGKIIRRCFKRHRAHEFLKFLREIEANVPRDLDIHTVMDNYATHKTSAIRNFFLKRPPLAQPFRPDGGVVAQPGSALLRQPDRKADPARCAPLNLRSGSGNHSLHRSGQRQTPPVDQVGRRYPRHHQTRLPGNAANRRKTKQNSWTSELGH